MFEQQESTDIIHEDTMPDRLVLFFKALKVTHLVVERNLFRKSLLPDKRSSSSSINHIIQKTTHDNNNNTTTTTTVYTPPSEFESDFHFRYFTSNESFVEWTKTAVLNPLLLKCSDSETHRLTSTQTLMQVLKGKTLPNHSRKGELISEVLFCLELLSLFWIRNTNDDTNEDKEDHDFVAMMMPLANRALSFSSVPYCRAAQEIQQSLPSHIGELYRFLCIFFEPLEELIPNTCSDGGVCETDGTNERIQPLFCEMMIWSFLYSHHDEFQRIALQQEEETPLLERPRYKQHVVTSCSSELLRCFNKIIDSSEERAHFFTLLLSVPFLAGEYFDNSTSNHKNNMNTNNELHQEKESTHKSKPPQEWKEILQELLHIPMQELDLHEKKTILKSMVNHLYRELFQWFQMKVNDHLVRVLQSVRGGYDETQGIPPELLLENQYLLIELAHSEQAHDHPSDRTPSLTTLQCPKGTNTSCIHVNHLEKFQKFREKRKRPLRSMTSHHLKNLTDTSSTNNKLDIITIRMYEKIKQWLESKFGNYSTFINDSAYMTLFEKPALSYAFCLNSSTPNDKEFERRIVKYLPEIMEFKKQILSVMSDVKLDVHVLDKTMMSESMDHTTNDDVLNDAGTSHQKIHELSNVNTTLEMTTSPEIVITNIPIPDPVSPPESKKKIFKIKKTKQREQKELELLREEVEELEKELFERKEIMKKIEKLKREKSMDDRNTLTQQVKLKDLSVLEKTIVKARSCLALCNIYHCDWYRDKIVEYLDQLRTIVETCENPSSLKGDNIVLKQLQEHLDEHSYYIGFQLPSLFSSLQENDSLNGSSINCSNFKGFQRLYKYMDIIERHVDMIPLSPLNVAECLKLCTRKLQSDLEILTQVRHFRSITLYNNHEIGCRVVKCIELLSLKSPYGTLVSVLLNEFHTIHVASELLRLSLKHFQAFKDYVYALLRMIHLLVEKCSDKPLDGNENNSMSAQNDNNFAKLDFNQESQDRTELDLITSSLSNASFTFSLIFAFNMSYSELNWNESTVFDILNMTRDCHADSVENAHVALNIPIARTSLRLLRLLLHNNYISHILNSCNRIERLLPENLIQALRTCNDIELQNEVIQLIDLGARRIAYKNSVSQDMTMCDLPIAEDASQFNEQVLGEIVNQKNCFTLFNYRDMFLDGNTPQILLLILHNHIMHYVDGNFGDDFAHKTMVCLLTRSIGKALYALLTEHSCDATTILSLIENGGLHENNHNNSSSTCCLSTASTSFKQRPSVDRMSLNQSFASSLSENGMKREIYSCLFYILLEALLMERKLSFDDGNDPTETSDENQQKLLTESPPLCECELFKAAWETLMNLMRISGDFRRCVDRQFASIAYLRDLSFLQLLLGTFNRSQIRFCMTTEGVTATSSCSSNDESLVNNFEKQDQLLKRELEKYGPDVLRDLHLRSRNSDDGKPLTRILECTPYELAKEILLCKRIHTRYEFDTSTNISKINHDSTQSCGPSLIEALCEKYTSVFFSHYAEQGVFEWNEVFSSVLEHSQQHDEELMHLQHSPRMMSPKRSNENLFVAQSPTRTTSLFKTSPQSPPLSPQQQQPSKQLSHSPSMPSLPGISPIKKTRMMSTQFPSSPSLSNNPPTSLPDQPHSHMKPKKLFL